MTVKPRRRMSRIEILLAAIVALLIVNAGLLGLALKQLDGIAADTDSASDMAWVAGDAARRAADSLEKMEHR